MATEILDAAEYRLWILSGECDHLVVLGCGVRYEPALYTAGGRELLEVVRALPHDVDTVMLIGHNPSLEELTATLCGSSPRYPAGALGTIEFTIDQWAYVAPGSGTLTAHVTPAQLQKADEP